MERLGRATWPEKPRGSGEGDGNRPNTIVTSFNPQTPPRRPRPSTFVIYLAGLPTARFCASCELSGVDSFQKQKRLDVFACADLSFASRSEKERTKPQQWI